MTDNPAYEKVREAVASVDFCWNTCGDRVPSCKSIETCPAYLTRHDKLNLAKADHTLSINDGELAIGVYRVNGEVPIFKPVLSAAKEQNDMVQLGYNCNRGDMLKAGYRQLVKKEGE